LPQSGCHQGRLIAAATHGVGCRTLPQTVPSPVPSALTFGPAPVNSRYLLPARFDGFPARFEIPRTIEPLAAHPSEEGWALRLFGFL